MEEDRAAQLVRTTGLEHAERQLAQLSSLFQEIGRLVHDHELQLVRIDLHTESAVHHLQSAALQVSQYHQQITSNHHLMVKIFLIFVGFFAFFVVFLL